MINVIERRMIPAARINKFNTARQHQTNNTNIYARTVDEGAAEAS